MDNTELNAGSGGDVAATKEATHGGDTTKIQVIQPVGVSGSEGSYTVHEICDADGLLVNLGTNNDVTVTSGTINLGATDTAALAAIQTAVELIDNAVSGAGFNITQLGGAAVPIGGGVEATALRVTVANDSTGVMTVDGTVTANPASGTIDTVTTVTAVTDITNTIDSTISGAALTSLQVIDNPVFVDDAAFTLTSSSVMVGGGIRDDSLTTLTAVEGDAVPFRVNSTGALHVTGAGGGTQYTEDAASSGGETGTLSLGYRRDADTSPVTADGDFHGLVFDATGNLKVNVKAIDASNLVDDAAFTVATDEVVPVAGVFTTDTVDAGDVGALAMDASRRLLVSLEVDNAGIGGGTEYTEDVATANPIVGKALMMERDDALTTVTPIEGDWVGARASAEGALWTQDFNSDASLALITTIDADTGVIAGDTTSIDGKITACDTGAVVLSSGTVTTVFPVSDRLMVSPPVWM